MPAPTNPGGFSPLPAPGSEGAPQASGPVFLSLGRVLRPHGVRGEVRVEVHTDYPERVADLETVYLGPDHEPHPVAGARMHRGVMLLRLADVRDRHAAERLRGGLVMLRLEDAVPLAEGEYFFFQLIGLRVQTTAGETLGVVTDIIETGANDVFVVEGDAYGEVLLPDIPQVVRAIDLEAGLITVELLEGLLAP